MILGKFLLAKQKDTLITSCAFRKQGPLDLQEWSTHRDAPCSLRCVYLCCTNSSLWWTWWTGPFTWPLYLLHHWYLAALRPFYTSKVYKHFEALYRNSLHWNALRCDDQGEACFEKYSGVSSAQASGERSISSTNISRRSQMCIYPFVQSRNLLEGIKPYQTSTNEWSSEDTNC